MSSEFYMDRVMYATSKDGYRYRVREVDGMVEISYEELSAGNRTEWEQLGSSITVNPEAVKMLTQAMQAIAQQAIEEE